MKKLILLLTLFISNQVVAQELLRITKKDGTAFEFSTNNVKEMDFYTPVPINVVGEWAFISGSSWTILDIKEDNTLIRKEIQAGAINVREEEETYTLIDNVLKMSYSGQFINITIVEYTDTKIVSSAGEIFYKIQKPIYSMKTTDNPITIGTEGDVVKNVDYFHIGIEDGKIRALRAGSGYALVENSESKDEKVYKVNIEYVPEPVVDWDKCFKKSEEEIINMYGDPFMYNEGKYQMAYAYYNPSILFVTFVLDELTGEAIKVQVSFYDEEKRKHYCDYIAEHYFLYDESDTRKIYLDNSVANSATVMITISKKSESCYIVYTDLNPSPAPLAPVIDWTQYFKKSGEQIKAEFGSDPYITDNEEDEDYSMLYSNVPSVKRVTFDFTKGFEKVTYVKVTFIDENNMQSYCDAIAEKYILESSDDTRKIYYDTDSPSTASVRISIIKTSSSAFISYYDLSE